MLSILLIILGLVFMFVPLLGSIFIYVFTKECMPNIQEIKNNASDIEFVTLKFISGVSCFMITFGFTLSVIFGTFLLYFGITK